MIDYSDLTRQIQRQCNSTLLSLLDDMFASCDDLYFDLASRAASNVEQNLYFESMREVRVKARLTREDFQLGLEALFAKLTAPQSASSESASIDSSELNLVEDDEVEQGVALSAMQTRARATNKGILYELCCRLTTAYSVAEVNEKNNPLDPAALGQLFADAARIIAIDIKARIILFKQYERYVINRLPEIYARINKMLKDGGVPFTSQQRSNRPGSRAQPGGPTASGSDEQLLTYPGQSPFQYGAPALGDLNQLLSSLRTSQGILGNQMPWFASGSGQPIATDELYRLIDASRNHIDAGTLDIRNFVEQVLSRGMPDGKLRAVQQIDEDVINLVAMFFDFVLDDENIPSRVKALVSRLQMPILKIALRDKTFFSNARHAARELVNEIARLSIGIDDADRNNELITKIDTIVHTIQDHTGDPVEIFESSLAELTKLAQDMEKRAGLVEKRTSESARGKAKTQVARAKTHQAIQEAMDEKQLPVELSGFIVKHWQEVLFTTYLRDGEESPAWLEQIQTMQDLIWCSQPHDDEKSKQRRARIRPVLYEKLQQGLKQSPLSAQEIAVEVKNISDLHDALAENRATVALQTFDAGKEEKLAGTARKKAWKEMTALERQKVEYQALTYEFIEKAEKVAVGSWLEFKDTNSGTLIRCKLATKLEESDNYIFVNRLGFKVFEKPRKEFAFDLQRKRARLLQTTPLFDRSLHNVVSRLKNFAP